MLGMGNLLVLYCSYETSTSIRPNRNYAEFMPERKKMMQSWADYLDELKSEPKSAK